MGALRADSPLRRLGIAFDGQPLSLQDVAEGAQRAEAAGFESVWIGEDYWTGRDAIGMVACAAQATRQIRVGTAVVNPYTRHPVLLAMTLNALRDLAGSRLVLGIGAGKPWGPILGDQMAEWPPLVAVRETVGFVRGFMREGNATWRGQTVNSACSRAWIRGGIAPLMADIPIYVGAYGPRMTMLAGEIGDGLLIGTGVKREEIAGQLIHLANSVERAQRELTAVDVGALMVAAVEDEGVPDRNTLSYVASRVASLTEKESLAAGFDPERVDSIRQEFTRGLFDSACDLLSSHMMEAYAISGPPSKCINAIERLADTGVGLPILLSLGGDVRELVRVGAEYIRSR